MENKLKELCQFICNIAKIDSKITENKLSYSELKALLQMVDVKGKGFLDLNDIYDLVGKVSENELFAIFKYLDTERNGEIRLQQLQQCLGDPNSSSNNTSKEYIFPRFYTVIDTIKDKPKLISEAKVKLALSSAQLKATYDYICSLVQTKYITNTQLVTVMKAQAMKYGLKWGKEQEKLVYEMLPGQNVSEAKFIQCFIAQKSKDYIEEENLLSGIETANHYQPRSEQNNHKAVKNQKASVVENDANSSIIYKKTNNFFEKAETDTPSFRQNNFAVRAESTCQQPAFKREFQQIEGNINGVLDAIQQRRERLRQDSLERKKLIDEVMNRKREGCGLGQTKGYSSPKQSHRRAQEVNINSFLNSLKASDGKGYLNSAQYNTSSHKQYSYPQKYQPYPAYSNQQSPEPNSYLNQSQSRSPQTSEFEVDPSDFKYNYRPQSPQASRTQQPFSPSANPDINQILKKYSTNKFSGAGRPEDDVSTLKQLCKSKSGGLHPQGFSGYSGYTSKYFGETWQGTGFRAPEDEQGAFNAKARAASKENLMKRAEEEAARKIEEIERKARMKVLEKKNALGRGDREGRDWHPVTRKGTYF